MNFLKYHEQLTDPVYNMLGEHSDRWNRVDRCQVIHIERTILVIHMVTIREAKMYHGGYICLLKNLLNEQR